MEQTVQQAIVFVIAMAISAAGSILLWVAFSERETDEAALIPGMFLICLGASLFWYWSHFVFEEGL